MATATYTLKNAKSEVIAIVKAQNTQDAQYISGVNAQATSTSVAIPTSESDNGRK